jgi:hypothetical protein
MQGVIAHRIVRFLMLSLKLIIFQPSGDGAIGRRGVPRQQVQEYWCAERNIGAPFRNRNLGWMVFVGRDGNGASCS